MNKDKIIEILRELHKNNQEIINILNTELCKEFDRSSGEDISKALPLSITIGHIANGQFDKAIEQLLDMGSPEEAAHQVAVDETLKKAGFE